MTNGLPRISYILATRNRADRLRGVIDRVLLEKRQYPDLELIVVDGGSTDGTVELLRSYGDAIDHWVSRKDSSVYEAYNTGFGLSTGEYVRILADDDEYLQFSLADVVRYGTDHPGTIVAGQAEFVSFRGDTHRRSDGGGAVQSVTLKAFVRWPVFLGFCHESIFFPRSVLERYGTWSAAYRIAGDFEIVVRMLKAGAKVDLLPNVIMRRTVHEGSLSLRNGVRAHAEVLWVLLSNGLVLRAIDFVVCAGIMFAAARLRLPCRLRGVTV